MIAPKEQTLMTIGYEGLDLPDFMKYLTWHNVDILVDVREIPLSRKKGFSKTALSEAVAEHGIEYEHIKALGSPKIIRNQLKADHDYDLFFSAYDEHLNAQNEALGTLAEIVEEHQNVCLLCFEQQHDQCHRSRIADRVSKTFNGHIAVEPIKTWL